jgi:hypothetical protein
MKSRDISSTIVSFIRSQDSGTLKDGTWYSRFVKAILGSYQAERTYSVLATKYNTTSAEILADRLITSFARISAGVSSAVAAAYTGAVAATIGSHGGASPITVPAAIGSFTIESFSTAALQLQLTHDIATAYGQKFNLDDPEDVWDLSCIAFRINVTETVGQLLLSGAPEGVRQLVKGTVHTSRLRALKSLPIIGKHLLQRNVIKMAIPVVGIGIAGAWTYVAVRSNGRFAAGKFRERFLLRNAVRDTFCPNVPFPAAMSAMLYTCGPKVESYTDAQRAAICELVSCYRQSNALSASDIQWSERLNPSPPVLRTNLIAYGRSKTRALLPLVESVAALSTSNDPSRLQRVQELRTLLAA